MSRRRLTVDERRDELIDTALELLSRLPADALSIDDVAAAAGASRALVYHYFGSWNDLYLAAARRAAEHLATRLRPNPSQPPLRRLSAAVTAYFDFVAEHAAGFRTLLQAGPAAMSGEVGEIVTGVRAQVVRYFMRELASSESVPALRMTIRSWIAAVEIAGLDWLQHQDLPRSTVESILVGYCVALLEIAAANDRDVGRLCETLLAGDRVTAAPPATRGQAGPQSGP